MIECDFDLYVKANEWISGKIKYSELGEKAFGLAESMDSIQFDKASFKIVVPKVTIHTIKRFFTLLNKGVRHIQVDTQSPQPTIYRTRYENLEGPGVPGSVLYPVNPPFSIDSMSTASEVTLFFKDYVHVRSVKGHVVAANLIRLANALAWSMTYTSDLTDTRVKLATWDAITINLENPWAKPVALEPVAEAETSGTTTTTLDHDPDEDLS